MKFLVVNGPNINMLGIREKHVYGEKTYESICNYIRSEGKKRNVHIDIVQNNIEGEIINYIQDAHFENYHGVIINPGAYTHYSIAIYDALKSINIPCIEVHLSNIYKREEFRHKSVTAPACIGQISGLGEYGYILAMEGLINFIK